MSCPLYNNLMSFLFAEEQRVNDDFNNGLEYLKSDDEDVYIKYFYQFCKKRYFDDLFKRLDVFLVKDYNCTK